MPRNVAGPAGTLSALTLAGSKLMTSHWFLGSLALAVPAFLGGYLLLRATPVGIGLGQDSIEYVAAARSLAAGGGLGRLTCSGFKPLIQWGPLYSVVLASFDIVGYDAVRAARAVAAVGYGATVLLGGLAAWMATKRLAAAAVAGILLLGSESVLRSFSWAMSESLYVPLTLAALVALSGYLARPSFRWLVGAAVLVSLALLTRYAGISLLATSILILGLNPTRRLPHRMRDAAILAVVGLVPFLTWWLRNLLVTGSAMYGEVLPVLPQYGTLEGFLATVASWLWPGLRSPALSISMGLGAAILAVASLHYASREWRNGVAEGNPWMESLLALHTLVYPLVVFGAKGLLNPYIDLSARMWVPMHVTFVILLPVVAWRLMRSRGRWTAILTAAILVLLVGSYALGQTAVAAQIGSNGQGFASWSWRAARSGKYLREIDDKVIYTNDIQAVYFLSGKPSCAIPTPTSSGTLDQMRQRLHAANGIVVIFGTLSAEFLPLNIVVEGLEPIEGFPEATVYALADG